jgi:hypothetical protein
VQLVKDKKALTNAILDTSAIKFFCHKWLSTIVFKSFIDKIQSLRIFGTLLTDIEEFIVWWPS